MNTSLVLSLAFVLLGCQAGIGPDPTDDDGSSGKVTSGSQSSGSQSSGSGPSSGSGMNEEQGYESGSRLKVRTLAAEDGSSQHLGFYDSQRAENCAFAKAADGQLRCFPNEGVGYVTFYYSDPQCTLPLASGVGCAGAKYAVKAPDGCGGGQRIYTLDAPHSGPAYILTPSSCANGGNPTGFYGVAGEIPLSSFVAASETVEP